MTPLSTQACSSDQTELLEVERSTAPTAPMNLLLRFETANGPRTVIACSVPLQTAREVADTMMRMGQHAEFIDRCTALSVADRLMMKTLQQLPQHRQSADPKATGKSRRPKTRSVSMDTMSPVSIAAE